MSEYHYKELLKKNLDGSQLDNDTEVRKKRKIGGQYKPNGLDESNNARRENQEVIMISDSDQESDNSINSSDFEDVSLEDEHESYGLDTLPEDTKDSNGKQESLSIAIHSVQEEVKKKRKFNTISKDERELRRIMHQMYVGLMLSHGVIRNRWCNDYNLLIKLRKNVSPQILELLHQRDSDDVLPLVKSRRFLDGLKKLMMMYSSNYRVTSQCLVRKNWNELSIKQSKTEVNVTFDKFVSLVTQFRGSRDIAAQGFVSLLRSVDLNARLIFSIQPPDYTSIAELPKIETNSPVRKSTHEFKQSPLFQKFGPRNNKGNLLASMRRKSTALTDEVKHANHFDESQYPIFWIEVWDKYVKKWVSIDPIVLQTIEVPPMRRKCKFEPPYTDVRNQLTYVIAYDRLGGVKDVTRRYSLYYNAKTVKKKIHFRSEEDEIWYNRILKASSLQMRKNRINKIDILESKEFHTRDLAEGVPNNIADFKNHPVYALESQLKQNEMIFPKDETSTCGFFRNKLSKTQKKEHAVIPIYKRSHVYGLRSAKAWYLRGRVLKVGVQPLKLKKKQVTPKQSTSDDDEDEETTRLYAEFQTKLYIPPPIVDSIIPKNAYGNIDVYTTSMLPANGYLVDTTSQYSMKIAERAARIIDIDYAKAIVAFDFGKSIKKNMRSRNPTAREGGMLIDIQYKEAMYLVMNTLLEEEETLRKRAVELNSLNNWKYFLTKLRISERLNKEHGKLKGEDEVSNLRDEPDDDNFSVHSDNSGSDRNEFEGGGFFIDSNSAADGATAEPNSEKYDSISYECEEEKYMESHIGEPRRNNGTNEDNYANEDKDFMEEQSGGGFFIGDAEIEGKYSQPKISETLNYEELEDLPDDYFKENENGELIYDPSGDGNQSKMKSAGVDSTDILKSNHDLPCSDSSKEVQPGIVSPQDSTPEDYSRRILLPGTDNDIEEPTRTMADKNDSCEPSSQKSLIELEGSQGSLGKDIADEEQVFGFEYSDSD